MAMIRKRLIRPIVYGTLGLMVLAFFLHPYGRQFVFGPRLDGMPLAWWQDDFRRAVTDEDAGNSFVTKALKTIGIKPIGAHAYRNLGKADMLSLVLSLTDDPIPDIRQAVAYSLGRYPESPEACDALLRLADDDSHLVRAAAAGSLYLLAPAYPRGIPKLREMMKDESPLCRLEAARSVYLLERDPAAIAMVRELMENREVGSTAVGSMLVLVGSDPEFIDDVHAICRKGGTAAYLGMMSLRKHDPKRSVPILSEILLQAEDNPRLVAAEELGRLGPDAKPALPRLIQLLDDRNPQVRIAAAKALSQIDPERYPQKKKPPQ